MICERWPDANRIQNVGLLMGGLEADPPAAGGKGVWGQSLPFWRFNTYLGLNLYIKIFS